MGGWVVLETILPATVLPETAIGPSPNAGLTNLSVCKISPPWLLVAWGNARAEGADNISVLLR